MRLYELAYCCHLYAPLDGFEQAMIDLRTATGEAVDPDDGDQVSALFEWLRRWRCRQFKIDDEQMAKESLASWWASRSGDLPDPMQTLDELDDGALERLENAYHELRWMPASTQHRHEGAVTKHFGPAGAAKALHAIRPNACPPWDAQIRQQFGLSETAQGYRHHLLRVRHELAQAVSDLGQEGEASQLPVLLDRPASSPVKLVDEHDWVRFTRGFEPPPPDLLNRWAQWGAG